MAEELQRKYTIGYALAAKKQQSFIQESLLNLAKSKGIDLVKIDLDRPLYDQGPFDCVLHKLYGDDWKSQLQLFKSTNPNAVVIDDIENIEVLHNRISMLNVVVGLDRGGTGDGNRKGNGGSSFGIPNQVVVYDQDGLFDAKVLGTLKFPMIAKPLVADGSAKSHKMVLVFNSGGLGKLRPPIVLQEFVNHGGVIFKVYVVGEFVKCVKRKSLPDVADDGVESVTEDTLAFSQVSNLGKKDRNVDSYVKMMHLEDAEMPPDGFLKDVAKGLRNALGLNLFNFDVIRDTKIGNRYLVIDINYFPGYAKMPGYENVLTDFFCDVLQKDRKVLTETDSGTYAGEVLGGKEDKLGIDTRSGAGKKVGNNFGSDEEDSRVLISGNIVTDEKEGQVQV